MKVLKMFSFFLILSNTKNQTYCVQTVEIIFKFKYCNNFIFILQLGWVKNIAVKDVVKY